MGIWSTAKPDQREIPFSSVANRPHACQHWPLLRSFLPRMTSGVGWSETGMGNKWWPAAGGIGHFRILLGKRLLSGTSFAIVNPAIPELRHRSHDVWVKHFSNHSTKRLLMMHQDPKPPRIKTAARSESSVTIPADQRSPIILISVMTLVFCLVYANSLYNSALDMVGSPIFAWISWYPFLPWSYCG